MSGEFSLCKYSLAGILEDFIAAGHWPVDNFYIWISAEIIEGEDSLC